MPAKTMGMGYRSQEAFCDTMLELSTDNVCIAVTHATAGKGRDQRLTRLSDGHGAAHPRPSVPSPALCYGGGGGPGWGLRGGFLPYSEVRMC